MAKLTAPLRIACRIDDRSLVWAGIVSNDGNAKTFVAPSYVWAAHFREGRIK